MSKRLLIDTDTASDDAVALIMALRSPAVEVEAITVVAGNVAVDRGVLNALLTVELCGATTPVYRGAERPLAREPVYAHWFHGEDGLGDVGYPPPALAAAPGHAADALVERSRARPGATLVTLGPLTNVALALERDPGFASRIGRCVVMGGAACTVGNVTPAAEFNLWADPEAAQRVFRSGLPIEMVGWELCRREANLDDGEMERLRALGSRFADFALDCNRTAIAANRAQSGDPGLALPDPVAMAIALEPAICTRRSRHYVEVETASELTRGMTVVDALGVVRDERNREVWAPLVAGGPNVTVCWEIDVAAWKEALYEALRERPEAAVPAGAGRDAPGAGRRPRIVVVGSSNTDMVIEAGRLPAPGETVLGGCFLTAAGGKGANQAVAAARLGCDVTLVARVGRDAFGDAALAGFERDGIRTEHVSRDPEAPSGVALILVGESGENLIAVAPGANARLGPADVDAAAEAIRGADLLLLQLEVPPETVRRAAEIARAAGARVLLDPAPAPAPSEPLEPALLAAVSILTPNEREAERLTGIRVEDDASAERACHALRERGVEVVVVTLGSGGCLALAEEGAIRVPGEVLAKDEALDATAAGDTFNGALAWALAGGRPLAEALAVANRAAAIAVTRRGAQPSMPTRRELERWPPASAPARPL